MPTKVNKEAPQGVTIEAPCLDVWLSAKEIAARLQKSPSTIYSLVRRKSGIPCAKIPGTKIVLFNWDSVNKWLHQLEAENRKKNFEE